MNRGKTSKIQVGDSFSTTLSGTAKVVSYESWRNVVVQFEDQTKVHCTTSALKLGRVRNPNLAVIANRGVVGVGKWSSVRHPRLYSLWKNIVARCQNPVYKSDKGSTMEQRWCNFQDFCADLETMKGFEFFENHGWHFSNHVLTQDNRWDRQSCCFIPPELKGVLRKSEAIRGDLPIGVTSRKLKNGTHRYMAYCQVLGGINYMGTYDTPEEAFQVYKEAKERDIKRRAEPHRDRLDPKVYMVFINHVVQITD